MEERPFVCFTFGTNIRNSTIETIQYLWSDIQPHAHSFPTRRSSDLPKLACPVVPFEIGEFQPSPVIWQIE